MLTFQRLDVYKCAIQFLALSSRWLATVPRGNGALTDQLRRAALSVRLNIAEAAGRTTGPDGARHYAIVQNIIALVAKLVVGRRQIHLLAMRLEVGILQDSTHGAVADLDSFAANVSAEQRSRPVRDRYSYVGR